MTEISSATPDLADAEDTAEQADAEHTEGAADQPGDGTAVPASTVDRVRSEHALEQQLEALLMIAESPLSDVDLATATDRPVREVRRALQTLTADYNGESLGPRRGFEIREVASGFRFYVRESLDPLISDFVHQRSPARLSQAALETLAVVAYRQPISRGAIASIRAVNVDSVVRTLVGRGLIVEAGHDPETGAVLYGTDEMLLEHLGITSLEELPPIAPLLDDGSAGFEHEDAGRGGGTALQEESSSGPASGAQAEDLQTSGAPLSTEEA
ncbi:SMC-Scp complex subunit ScpB [Leucobacter sp. GX24907]